MGTAERIKNLRRIIPTTEPVIVVLSAMAGVTNSLVESINLAQQGKMMMAKKLLTKVEQQHISTCKSLFSSPKFKTKGMEIVKKIMQDSAVLLHNINTSEKQILVLGETLSSNLLHIYLCEQSVESALLPALSFMRIDKDGAPDYFYTSEKLSSLLESSKGINTIITQGFICRNALGGIDNLNRGGSDYSAAIIGNVIDADEVQIWTDIDGIHNNDPRHVKGTQPVRELSFDEAAELAYFGAKILHPASIHPCRERNIPVVLKNTLRPDDKGTRITSSQTSTGIKAVAAKDNISVIRIKSLRMLMAYGFLKQIFDIFNNYRTPVDLITTSEVAVTVTIDETSNLASIVDALKEFSSVDVVQKQTIVCVVGDFLAENPGMASAVFKMLEHIPISLISYGGSSHNITFLVSCKHKKDTLLALQGIMKNPLIPETSHYGNTGL